MCVSRFSLLILVGRYGLPQCASGESGRGPSSVGNRREQLRLAAAHTDTVSPQVVEDGYEFFAKRQLVTLFSAPNYCGEFDNAGAMMSVDETLMCSFQVSSVWALSKDREITRPFPRAQVRGKMDPFK